MAHQDSNLGPTDYESLADNQPQQPASLETRYNHSFPIATCCHWLWWVAPQWSKFGQESELHKKSSVD
jgi:hypothetical protein